MKENIVQEKSFDFAVEITLYSRKLKKEHQEYAIADQLLRCGTSVGANIEEAIGGYTRKDFAAKLSISYKEARETRYWLRILEATKLINKEDFDRLFSQCEELLKLLYSIIRSTKNN